MSDVSVVSRAWLDKAPWLDASRQQVRYALAGDKLAHALLIHGQSGVGKAALAEWITQLVLCDQPGEEPCGVCQSCRFYLADTHPDIQRVGIPEGKKQIPVDDVREMITSLRLMSGRRGRKVAIIDPADAMNANGANALLKTLEEPPAGTLLILTVARLERLPPTVASRCSRVSVKTPSRADALTWLAQVDSTVDWNGPLALASGAPVAAMRLVSNGGALITEQMAELPAMLRRPDTDVIALAERSQAHFPAERLRWLEHWLCERIRRGLGIAVSDHNLASQPLPAEARKKHIQALYGLLDQTRLAQSALRGSANVTLLFETLYFTLARELEWLLAQQPRS